MSLVKSPEELSAREAGKKDKIVVEKDEAEELLPGWKKEVKIRKTGSATKVDRFYTDPVTGYIFRSLKDVQRYLKTGELGRLAIKPKMVERVEPSELKEPMSETLSQKRAAIDKSESPVRASKRLAPVLPPPSPKTRQATRQSGSKTDASVPSPVPPKTRQAVRQAGIKIDSPPPLPPDSETRQAPLLTGTEIGPSPPSQPEPKTRQAKRVSGIRDDASPASPPQPKTRPATRQSGIKINSPSPSLPDTRTSRQATRTRLVNAVTLEEIDKKTEVEKIIDNHNQNADLDANPNHDQENQESNKKQELHKEHNKEIEMGSATSPPPTVVPPVNTEKQELPVVNPTISNPIPPDGDGYGYGSDVKADSSVNFSMNDLWTDPCIEFAVKTLTGAIPVTDLNKVENFTAPLEMPQELWTDPCIEFAVKTLTGAIPVGEDDHLLHRPASSANPRGPHQFSSADVLSKHYETGHKNRQQDSVLPTLGNGGLQKSGNFVNGSRFFQ